MRLLKEPVVQFGLLAALVFGYYGLVAQPPKDAPDSAQVEITQTDVQQLVANFTATWKRAPTVAELDSLVEDKIREEILVREALALGLDQGDAVIRNRLRQKLQFVSESVARSVQPTDAELQNFLEDHRADFLRPAQIAFQQVFLGPEATGDTVAQALADLRAGGVPAHQPSLLPDAMGLTPLPQVDRTFGDGFAQQVQALPLEEWSGPVRSGYGVHLLRVTQQEAAHLPDLESLRDKLQGAWYHAKAEAFAQTQMEALLSTYDVSRPTTKDLSDMVAQ